MAVLGILFDIDALGSSQYGMAAYRILFSHVDHLQLRGARFRDGDTRATLSRRANVYCIAIESIDPAVTMHVAERLSSATDRGLLPSETRLLRDPAAVRSEPLVRSGAVNDQGEFIVDNDSFWVERVWKEARDAAPKRRREETAGMTNEFERLVAELIAIGRKAENPNYSNSGFLIDGASVEECRHPRAREIGNRLHEIGGWDMMSWANQAVRDTLGPIAAQELSAAWIDVGDWLH